jgi:hypothetical protein
MILPLQAILFQFFLLLVSIAVEAIVLQRSLRLAYRTSIEYSASLNLWSCFLGWLLFFILQTSFSEGTRLQLISYVFFNNFFPTFQEGQIAVIMIATISFFLICLIEYKGLDLIQAILQSSQEFPINSEDGSQPPLLATRLKRAIKRADTNKAFVILVANAWSHALILLFLFIRLGWQD